MDFQVINRGQAHHVEVGRPYAVISITETDMTSARYPSDKYIQGILYLRYHDVDPDNKEAYGQGAEDADIQFLNAMTKADATRILQFMNLMKDSVEVIVCQCMAGISRSAATAAALSKIITGDDSFFFDHYVPNRYVYRLILETFYDDFDDIEKE